MRFSAAWLFLVLWSVSMAFGQTQAVSFLPSDDLVKALKADITAGMPDESAEISSLLGENVEEFAQYSLGEPVYVSLVEENRLDKQVGASSAGVGSTSLVSKGSVPSLIGVAVESGALYQSVSGTAVTFRLHPAGLARALANSSYLGAAPPAGGPALERVVNRLSASATFDFQQGSSPGTFTAERSQLLEATARFDIINKRDPRHRDHANAIWELRGDLGPSVSAISDYTAALKAKPEYREWVTTTAGKLVGFQKLDDAALKALITAAADDFVNRFGGDPELSRLSRASVDRIREFRAVRDSVFRNIARSSVLTFEYAFNKLTVPEASLASLPMGTVLPDLSTGRLIYSSPIGSVGEATLNGSVTFFNSTLPQMRGNLRDVQVAGSLDLRLPELRRMGKPILTFAGLGAFLHQQPFGVKVKLRDVETADGAIGVFQAKLTFPAGRSGIRIPVSFTAANRSEFNTERELRGSIGFTFDLDKIFAN